MLANVDNGSAEELERNLGAAVLGAPVEFPAERSFVSVADGVLQRYLGSYRSEFMGRPIDFTIESKGRELVASFPLLPRAHLRPMSERRFLTRLKGTDVVLDFALEGEGAAVTGIDVNWAGTRLHWPRISTQ